MRDIKNHFVFSLMVVLVSFLAITTAAFAEDSLQDRLLASKQEVRDNAANEFGQMDFKSKREIILRLLNRLSLLTGKPLKEVGEVIDLTSEQISRLNNSAIPVLISILEDEKLD